MTAPTLLERVANVRKIRDRGDVIDDEDELYELVSDLGAAIESVAFHACATGDCSHRSSMGCYIPLIEAIASMIDPPDAPP